MGNLGKWKLFWTLEPQQVIKEASVGFSVPKGGNAGSLRRAGGENMLEEL